MSAYQIVCQRVADVASPLSRDERGTCERCGTPVWVPERARKTLGQISGGGTVCLPCMGGRGGDEDAKAIAARARLGVDRAQRS